MPKVFGASVAVVLLLLFGACQSKERTEVQTTTTAKMSDGDLEKAVKAKLDADPDLRKADLGVSANADNKEVRLSGTVESEAMRSRAVELARSSGVGLIITDRIDVKPRELSRAEYGEQHASDERSKASKWGDRVGNSVDDAWIHSKLVAKLILNPDTPERKINIDVDNGVVTLRGTVDNAEAKTEAERSARSIDGVKRVINQMKVVPGGQPAKTSK